MFTTRYTVAVAIHLFIFSQGNILLLKRINTGIEDGKFGVPAGHLEQGESLFDAAIRELYEETSLKATTDALKFAGIRYSNVEKTARVDLFVAVNSWNGQAKNCEPEKCDQFIWSPITSLPENTINFVSEAIKRHQSNEGFFVVN